MFGVLVQVLREAKMLYSPFVNSPSIKYETYGTAETRRHRTLSPIRKARASVRPAVGQTW